jgi:2,3-bisphosphoglycerate-dependent phosphoglycerate mutase
MKRMCCQSASTLLTVTTQLVFETHSWSTDNESDIATGWLPGQLSSAGEAAARELGARRHDDDIAVVFCSDLRRAEQTAEIAFVDTHIPILRDWRLRECDYGRWNGADRATVHGERRQFTDRPYPGGESWRQAVARVATFLPGVAPRWRGGRVLVIGHIATKWALDHALLGVPLEALVDAEFEWREGWEYALDDARQL